MLLTIRTTDDPATDLGFLLHKHPDHVHTRAFPFGTATVFYPEASPEGCTAAILLDVDAVATVRGRAGRSGTEDQLRQRPPVRGLVAPVSRPHPLVRFCNGGAM